MTGALLRLASGLAFVSHGTVEDGIPLDWDEAAGLFIVRLLTSLGLLLPGLWKELGPHLSGSMIAFPQMAH